MKKNKVLLISPLPPPHGGIARWTSLIKEKSYTDNDIDLRIIDTATRWRKVTNQYVLYRILGGGLHTFYIYILFLWELITNRPKVVHLTSSGSFALLKDVLFLLTCRLFIIKSIYHLRYGEIPYLKEKNKFLYLMQRVTIKICQDVIYIDTKTFEYAKQFKDAESAHLIQNCCVVDEFNSKFDKNSRKILYVGWVVETKGVEELIHAWQLINREDWVLEIIGPVDDVYKKHLESIDTTRKVTFRGGLSHKEVMKALNDSAIFVLPSYSEGFPNVIIEAMAAGKAIIATDVGAIPEMLGNNCGIVISPKNISQLVNSINDLISDERKRMTLGLAAAHKATKEYDIEVVYEKYKEIWLK